VKIARGGNPESPGFGRSLISANLIKASAGDCILSRRDSIIVARHEVLGWSLDIYRSQVGRFWPEAEGAASRRDDTDRSQVRSAWKSVNPGEPSRRVRYDRARLIPEASLVKMCAVFLKEG
jgi:hypothetical protein